MNVSLWINFNRVDLAFRCPIVVLEWEGFGLEFFWNNTSLYIYKERERGEFGVRGGIRMYGFR